jgi:hypothetical protein
MAITRMTDREEMRTTAEMLNMSMASNCSTKYILAGDAAITGNYFAIQIINDTVFSALVDANNEEGITHDLAATELSSITIAAGIVIYGDFTSINLTTGIVCAFKVN